jgi:hypothetical protein
MKPWNVYGVGVILVCAVVLVLVDASGWFGWTMLGVGLAMGGSLAWRWWSFGRDAR